jgi:hypothetical protein
MTLELEFLVDGAWLLPLDPPPGFLNDPAEAWRHGMWSGTMPLLFDHPEHGLVKIAPAQCLARRRRDVKL